MIEHMGNIPKSVTKRITNLRNNYDAHIDIVHQMVKAGGGKLFGVDLVIIGVIQRSLSLIDGFTSMVEKRNALCAGALLRLQVDNIMRLYACWLVNDPHSLIQPLLEGKLNKVKSKKGKALSDKYLRAKVSELYPWVDRVYKDTSGFIHLSMPHLLAPVTDIDDSSRSFAITVGKQGREWAENEMIEAMDAFIEATKSVLHLAVSWLETKEKVAAERDINDA